MSPPIHTITGLPCLIRLSFHEPLCAVRQRRCEGATAVRDALLRRFIEILAPCSSELAHLCRPEVHLYLW